MLEFVEKSRSSDLNSRDAVLIKVRTTVDNFRVQLHAAIGKYKSSFTYSRHEKSGKKKGVIHPRVADVIELQSILDHANYAIPLKEAMLNYINDPNNFKWSKLSPLRRYVRNTVNHFLDEHSIELLQLSDAILAVFPNDGKATPDNSQHSVDEDSETTRSEELEAQERIINSQKLQLQQSADENERIRIELAAMIELKNRDRAVVMQLSAEENQRISLELVSVQKELASTQSSIVEIKAVLDHTTGIVRELELKNDEQAQVIHQQNAHIASLKSVIGELKVSVETFKMAAHNMMMSLSRMFMQACSYIKYCVKVYAKAKQSDQPNLDITREPIHSLITEKIDPATKQSIAGEIIPNYTKLMGDVETIFAKAEQLCEKTNITIVDEEAIMAKALQPAPSVTCLEAAPAAPAPPSPPQALSESAAKETPARNSVLAACAAAKAKRLAEGGNVGPGLLSKPASLTDQMAKALSNIFKNARPDDEEEKNDSDNDNDWNC